ncbi:MAG TPA: energy transducer TonB [Thermoanaerobaculia bacterium]|jgi:protein TonB|nr:energy transducer TonB [Thermoanaerobaculia bacterium]
MFDDVLIESAGKHKQTVSWITAMIAGVIHVVIIAAIARMYVEENPQVIEKPIGAFIVASAPPPPPPPPPASSAGQTPPQTRIEPQREQPREQFRQPSDIRETPQIDTPTEDSGATAGVVAGGQKGGKIGGVIGGEIGGEIGGQLGGKIGGQIGGTGDMPIRVGGNVRAPVAVKRVDPVYTEVARKARVEGIVIIEAVIDRQGNVTEARVLKGLPFGLDLAALNAIRQWKFQPGTLNGQPVPVYYNLTVNFRIE